MRYPVVLFTAKGRAGKDTAAKVVCEELGGQTLALADPIKRFFLRAGLTVEQLWGSEKEVHCKRPELHGAHCKFWLSEALSGWKTAVELQRIDFDRWVEQLPETTTPRHLMQTFGTECVRSYSPDLWVDFGLYAADELLMDRAGYSKEGGLIHWNRPTRGLVFTPAAVPAPPRIIAITDGRFRNEVLKVKAKGGVAYRIVRPEGVQEGFADAAKQHASESEQDGIPNWWFDRVIYNDRTLTHFEHEIANMARYTLAGGTNTGAAF